jgi:hypothetical protein
VSIVRWNLKEWMREHPQAKSLEDRVEPEEPQGARSIGTPETTEWDSAELLEQVVSVRHEVA